MPASPSAAQAQRAIGAIIVLCFHAGGRNAFLDAQRHGDAMRFAVTAGAFATQHGLDEADREAILARPFANIGA